MSQGTQNSNFSPMTTKEYISKDEVEVILKKYHRYSKSLEEIRALPTFSPEKIIEKKNDLQL